MHTILLLDDEEFALEALKEEVSWEMVGIGEVLCASSVREAKAVLKEREVGILLCDIEMPGESGLDLVEWATEYARFSGNPMVCVMLTCHPEYAFLRKAMQLGCQDYLLKPVDSGELEEVLKKAVLALDGMLRERKQEGQQGTFPEEAGASGRELIHKKILPYIEQNLGKSFSVGDLADLAGLNPQYLMRIFKKETTLSILEYVTQKRMERAKELLLKTQLSIEAIAKELGYYNYTYFMKVFKKNVGKTPGEYRKSFH